MSKEKKLFFLSLSSFLINLLFYKKLMKDFLMFNYLKRENLDITGFIIKLDNSEVKVQIVNQFYTLGYEYILLIVVSIINIFLLSEFLILPIKKLLKHYEIKKYLNINYYKVT